MTTKNTDLTPPCANYKVWYGKEIEGADCQALHTLFVRSLTGTIPFDVDFSSYHHIPDSPEFRNAFSEGRAKVSVTDWIRYIYSSSNYSTKIDRVWFCKEFPQADIVRLLPSLFSKNVQVAVEVDGSGPPPLQAIIDHCIIYVKLPALSYLQPKDYICVGPAFKDTIVKLDKGHKVKPSDYFTDIPLVE